MRELSIQGAYEVIPVIHRDERGSFNEGYKAEIFEQVTGRTLHVAQTNVSVNRRGALRGLHFAQLPPSQGKFVTCMTGSVLDVVVDIRVGSPTFGRWDAVLLDDASRASVFVGEGLGHGFVALAENSVVTYAVTAPFAPGREFGIDPLDPALGIDWPTVGRDGEALSFVMSPKDQAAPTLAQALEEGLLPSYEEWVAFDADLRRA